jgi:hypothetical protein
VLTNGFEVSVPEHVEVVVSALSGPTPCPLLARAPVSVSASAPGGLNITGTPPVLPAAEALWLLRARIDDVIAISEKYFALRYRPFTLLPRDEVYQRGPSQSPEWSPPAG